MTSVLDGLDEGLRPQIEKLVKRGEHAAAAAALRHAGHPRAAGALYEQIFEHGKALAAYEAAGDVVAAMRVAIAAGDAAAVERVVGRSIQDGTADALLASLMKVGRDAEAARIYAARGDLALAAERYEAAGQYDKAAECMEEDGDLRRAGVLLERWLEREPGDPSASLRLGRILSRFSRHDDGVTLLQKAIKNAGDPDHVLLLAAPTLVFSFVALGYEDAARAVLERWARVARARGAAAPPATLDEFLRSERAAAFAAVVAVAKRGSKARVDDAVDMDAFAMSEPPRATSPDPDGPSSPDAAGDAMLLAGRYLLGEPLGGGGTGQVFRAFDAFTDRPVAVKIFGAQAMRSEAVKAYAREARAASALSHPAIVRIVELNTPQGYVVSELVESPPLESVLREGGDAGWIGAFAKSLLGALAACHRTGIVHGALKPTNLFLVPGGVRVVDVGAHRLLALRSTETGGLASIWPYLSPEQLFGAPADAAADLYAVGAILYRALTGRPPFARAEDDRRRAPAPAGVSASWDAFLARALDPDPARRFADATEMAAELPPVPAGATAPPAASLGGEERRVEIVDAADRYDKTALVERGGGVRVYEGTDRTVGRTVWIVEADDERTLAPLYVAARLWRGVQPIYDAQPGARRFVVARDAADRRADVASLRAVPQGLTRDLRAAAEALEHLHAQGLALDGFPIERAIGPVGPRLRFAPAPLPVAATEASIARDWASFAALVDACFGVDPSLDANPKARLVAALEEQRVIDRADVDALISEGLQLPTWSQFLGAVVQRLVLNASSRVIARLAAGILRGA